MFSVNFVTDRPLKLQRLSAELRLVGGMPGATALSKYFPRLR
jgi:hypothetical protein